MATEQVDKLITFGQMALEQGWYDQARDYFEQALALDASNREVMKGLARANEILSRREAAAVEPIEDEPVEPAREYVEWLEKCPFCKEGRIYRERKPGFRRFEPLMTVAYACDSCTVELTPSVPGEGRLQCVSIDKRYPEMQVYHYAKLTREELIRISEGGRSDLEQKRRFADNQVEKHMPVPEFQAKGHNGQIELYRNKVCIRRKGVLAFLTQGLKGDKEIMISSISSIQFKKASAWTNGYIQFSFIGGQEAKGGIWQATTDENTVMFTAEQQLDFERIKAEIEKRIRAESVPSMPSSDADEIAKLADLRDKGILTEEEFQQKKKQILGL